MSGGVRVSPPFNDLGVMLGPDLAPLLNSRHGAQVGDSLGRHSGQRVQFAVVGPCNAITFKYLKLLTSRFFTSGPKDCQQPRAKRT